VGTPDGALFVAFNELDEAGKVVVVARIAGKYTPRGPE
jgi:hypothetical protein